MSKIFDYYAILGVDPQADTETIRIAFQTLQNSFAPGERDPARNPDYQRISNAYDVLKDPARRATYDSLLVETAGDLDIELTLSRDKISISDADQRLYLLVDIRPPKQTSGQNLPLNLCLVVDRSTSMQGTRLESVITALELVVDKLTPNDVLSLVSFSDRATVVSPAGTVTNKTPIISRLRTIQASGGTEIYQGLKAGVKEMHQFELSHYANHLILLTDGRTYGDDKECLDLAQKAAADGITISAFGIGSDWNDQFLDRLVAPSGGESGFIERPADVVEKLKKRVSGLGTTFALDVRLQPSPSDFTSFASGFKIMPSVQPLDMETEEIKLGNVEGRSRLAVLLEINVAPQKIERRFNIPVNLVMNIPAPQMREQVFSNNCRIQVLKEAPQEMPPEAIVEAVRMLNLYQMSEKVWEEVEAGDTDLAAKRMRHLTTRLLEAGETQLAHQANLEVERIAHAGTMSLEGRKKLKFGTRALINHTSYFDDDSDD